MNDLKKEHLYGMVDAIEVLLRDAQAERDALRAFAQDVMRAWPEGDVDGGELQDAAVRHGLLRETHPTEPCGENCWCAEYYGDDEMKDGGATCYKHTELLSPNA